MFGRIGIVYDQRSNALKIPRTALIESTRGMSVFVVEDDIAKRRSVETGYSERGMVEILSGLEDGDEIITVGQVGLKEDSKVTVINRPADASEPTDETDESEIRTADIAEGE